MQRSRGKGAAHQALVEQNKANAYFSNIIAYVRRTNDVRLAEIVLGVMECNMALGSDDHSSWFSALVSFVAGHYPEALDRLWLGTDGLIANGSTSAGVAHA